jgi:hypothetical protein
MWAHTEEEMVQGLLVIDLIKKFLIDTEDTHQILPWVNSIKFISPVHFTKIHFNTVSQTSPTSLKRSSVIRIPIKKLYTFHISLMNATHLACLSLLNFTPNNAK